MSIELYEEQASVIRNLFKRDRSLAEEAYRNLSDIFIQDAVAGVGGEPFYGTSMSRKGNVLFQLQELFI